VGHYIITFLDLLGSAEKPSGKVIEIWILNALNNPRYSFASVERLISNLSMIKVTNGRTRGLFVNYRKCVIYVHVS